MSTNVPLKLRLEPGEYQCYASLPDPAGAPVRLAGLLSLQPNRLPELSLHGDIPGEGSINPANGETWYTYPQVNQLPLIAVDLVRGNDVLLLDCTIEKLLPQRAVITAAAALVGVTISPITNAVRFSGLTIQISGADAVTVPPPLEQVTLPLRREPDVPVTWAATERLPRKITSIDAGDELRSYWYASYSGGDGYTHRVSFSPVIDVHLAEPVDIDTLRQQWLLPLTRIIGLSTGRVEAITYLDVELGRAETPFDLGEEFAGENRELQVFGTNITQQPYAPRGNDLLKIEQAFNTHGEDDTSLLKLCRGWQTALTDRHPLVETLGTFLSLPPQHPRARFLLLIQALEGLHGHNNSEKFESRLAKHQASRDQARAAVQACEELDPKVRKFIRATLPKWPASGLDHALHDVVASLPVDLTPKLGGLDLVTALIADDQADDWASALRIVRNGLSHGRRSWPPRILGPAADLLEVIARAHLMRAVGVNDTSIHDYLDRTVSN